MRSFHGNTLDWRLDDGVLELELRRPPLNEIGSETLAELEKFVAALGTLEGEARAVVVRSALEAGFSAGADLRELYRRTRSVPPAERDRGVRDFLERIHRVLNAIDAAPVTTIAAVHGVCFGGGLELALVCDVIVAERLARFCFPELRLGLIPGFGGIPRLKRDLGNAIVRDLLLTGRSINAERAYEAGLVGQLAGAGEAARVARATAAQVKKFDRDAAAAAKRFLKPVPYAELRQEIELFCELFARPTVDEALRKFLESKEVLPYLP